MSDRALFVLGIAGPREADVFARICVWCDIPHPIGAVDRQLVDQGVRVTHGMCEDAELRLDVELERALERRSESPCR